MSLITSLIPLPYRIGIVAVAVLTIAVGSFSYGKHLGDIKSAQAIAAFTIKKNAEETTLLGLNTITNTKIVTQYVTETVHIHDRANQIQQQIAALPPNGLLNPDWVRLYNDSISPSDAAVEPTGPVHGAASGVDANQALSTIADNNAKCLSNSAELKGLQTWVTDTNANITAANKRKK